MITMLATDLAHSKDIPTALANETDQHCPDLAS